ncbi:hypothetical protein A2614_00420 [Candidatus Woesebacteria bacterium RIFOXYD1_FULL_40_21]|uniref:Sortase n=1 Tax=Candidatus Woesebacteria bacterium RIFOXYD1_FULL_40_21 TaxID=1802549 RepID=A0A1F8DI85_9BACT|nr:MAG: hypothetical protein A2614_00420 [Candidatus Woesebacteria bacterium RIFOXYD1_FULL_40_21]
MFPRGTVYKSGYPSYGEITLGASLKTKIAYTLARGIGAGLIGFAVISIIFTLGPVVKEEVLYDLGFKKFQVPYSQADLAKADSIVQVQKEAAIYGVGSYFSVIVPKIGAYSDIVANVDASDEKEYLSALEKGVAHAKGTYFPGQGENIFLFSHSTDSPVNIARYNAVFYLLGKLETGDKIIVFFADKKYEYRVEEKKVVAANDTSWLTNKGQGERLILQTCDPPGTTWKRLLVIAKPVRVDPFD